MAPPRASIGREELQLLRYIADHEPVSVREVADHVAATTGKARTTVLTVMERLRRKGYLTRRRVQGTYRYSPCVDQAEFLQHLVGDFVQETLGGSVSPFVTYLSQGADLTAAELEQLKRLVDDLDAPREGEPR